MQCAETRKDLVAYVDGETTRAESQSVELHLRTCPSCRAERAALEATGRLLERLPRDGGCPGDLARRVVERARREEVLCAAIRPFLTAYADGESSPEERIAVDSHLAVCDDCRDEVDDLARTGRALAAWRIKGPSPEVGTRAVARASWARRGAAIRRISAAAAAIVLIAVGFRFSLQTGSVSPPKDPPPEVLRNMDVLQAESLHLLDQPPAAIEVARHLDWLESIPDDEVSMLSGSGG